MTTKRYVDIITVLDPEKWPNPELCMYVNRISPYEVLEVRELTVNKDRRDYYKRGVEAYTGKRVADLVTEEGWNAYKEEKP